MKFLIALSLLLTLNFAKAQDQDGDYHTANFCATSQTCAHLKFEKYPNTTDMSEFLIHLLPSASTSTIENVTAKLWMEMGMGHGHGHGSAPLQVTAGEEANHYNVTNGWFVMRGTWQVIVSFKENGVDQQIIIPVEIKE